MEIWQKHIKNNYSPGKQTARPSKRMLGRHLRAFSGKVHQPWKSNPRWTNFHHQNAAKGTTTLLRDSSPKHLGLLNPWNGNMTWARETKPWHEIQNSGWFMTGSLHWLILIPIYLEGIVPNIRQITRVLVTAHMSLSCSRTHGFWAPLMILEDIEHWIAFTVFCLANTGEHVQKPSNQNGDQTCSSSNTCKIMTLLPAPLGNKNLIRPY